MAQEDRDRWDAAHARKVPEHAPPSPFVVENAALLPAGRTLDLACGMGRHSRFLAGLGHQVVAVDISAPALRNADLSVSPNVVPVLMDLDVAAFRRRSFDAIVNVSFLDRRLFVAIDEWLRPGGILLFETFLADQAAIGHPRNPVFLLDRNELLERLGRRYRVLRYREGLVVERGQESYRAGVVAELRAD